MFKFEIEVDGTIIKSFWHDDQRLLIDDLQNAINQYISGKDKKEVNEGYIAIDKIFTEHKNIPIIALIYSGVLRLEKNYEASSYLAAEILRLYPEINIASDLLNNNLADMEAKESPKEYIELALLGQMHYIWNYIKLADKYFADNNFEMTDHYLVRTYGLMHVYAADKLSITDSFPCDHDNMIEWEKIIAKQFEPETTKHALTNDKKWSDDLNKFVIADYVVNALDVDGVVVELGAHMGTLLNLIQQRCKHNITTIGIERDPIPVELSKKNGINIHIGNHDDMINGKIKLPETFDVLLLSYMCLLNPPEVLDEIIEFASQRCNHIIIADQLLNMFNDKPIFWRYYIAHPFRQVLEKYGFNIVHKQLLPVPTVAANGILIASKDNDLDFKPPKDSFEMNDFAFYSNDFRDIDLDGENLEIDKN